MNRRSSEIVALVAGWLLLFAAALLGPGAQPAQAQDTPAPLLDAQLVKTVTANPAACGTATSIDAAPATTVYICYTLTNTGSLPIDPFDLIDNFDTANFETVAWQKPAGFVLQPGATLAPTLDNGLVRPVTVSASQTSAASWGVAAADGSQTRQVTSNATTINVVTLNLQATLTGATTAGTTPSVNCALPSVTLASYQSSVYLCVTLSNGSSITLTRHHISIPGFGIDFTIDKNLGPSGSAATPIRITNADNGALAPRLSTPTMISRAYITSTNAVSTSASSLSVSAVTEPVVVNGPAASVTLQKTLNTDPNTCSTATTLSNVTYGQTFYYCLVLINSASLTYTDHVFTEPALKIAGSLNEVLAPGGRITLTNTSLQVNRGVTPFLGPFTATQSLNTTMVYTASNPTLGYRAVTSASASLSVLTPTPTNTGAPTPTYTPIPFDTPIPSPTITPIPATPTPTWTWTPSPTPTPPPTVLVFSTPGGQPPTPYPPIPGLQASVQTNQFVSPLEPFAATATAQAQFSFPTPVLDPFGATATAQAQFAFPTPVLDPFGATATAQAQFAFPTPVLDPFGATATAQAQFAFPTPVLDPFGATATAQIQTQALLSPLAPPALDPFAAATASVQAQLIFPTPMIDPQAATATTQALLAFATPALDALAATAIAQSATISAALAGVQAGVAPAEAALLPPNGVMTVTAAFTSPAESAQRPVQPPASAPPADTRSFFLRVLESAGSTVALLWFLGGSVLFFITAGVLAGLSFRARERSRFVLQEGEENAEYVVRPAGSQPAPDRIAGGEDQAPLSNKNKADDNWPASLP